MLILTRKVNERVTIGGDVEITVLKVSRDKVKLGIVAPGTIIIQRNELLASVGEENVRAASGTLTGLERLVPALQRHLNWSGS